MSKLNYNIFGQTTINLTKKASLFSKDDLNKNEQKKIAWEVIKIFFWVTIINFIKELNNIIKIQFSFGPFKKLH